METSTLVIIAGSAAVVIAEIVMWKCFRLRVAGMPCSLTRRDTAHAFKIERVRLLAIAQTVFLIAMIITTVHYLW